MSFSRGLRGNRQQASSITTVYAIRHALKSLFAVSTSAALWSRIVLQLLLGFCGAAYYISVGSSFRFSEKKNLTRMVLTRPRAPKTIHCEKASVRH